ncbi:hypothetical protein [Pseudoalteromonas ostreae]|uniref:hypothetical protein n=1 Tax=Pseudoalteromonas ostreae TaxID=2774154 RepID=UPI001B37F6CC|nr:hypothetical protein [Pseudoalteromonas ostreae]
MKAKIVVAVFGTVVISYLGWSLFGSTDEVQPQAETSKVVVSTKENKEPKHSQQEVATVKKSVDEIIEEANLYSEPSAIIEKVSQFDSIKKNEYYEFIISNFPELKGQVNEYREATRIHKERLDTLTNRVKERNKDAIASGSASQSLDDDILYEQKQLVENARLLGKQAMVLNEAIRQVAFN